MRVYRTLSIIDEFTREALAIRVNRRLNSTDVVDALTDLFIMRGPAEFIRSHNGAEFIAKKVRAWIGAVGAKTAFIAPGSPWEIAYCESFNARFRPSCLMIFRCHSIILWLMRCVSFAVHWRGGSHPSWSLRAVRE